MRVRPANKKTSTAKTHGFGVDDLTIQSILRHAHVSVTQACYIKTLSGQVVDAMGRLEGAFVEGEVVEPKRLEA